MPTLIQRLAEIAVKARFETLSDDAIVESRRIILDSIGCALGGVDQLKGTAGVAYARAIGGSATDATIIGAGRSSVLGAAFANAELMNALDFDLILPPGHVTPYVLPVALAVAESAGASGRDLIVATAIAHEISFRFGKAMDNLRDTKDGQVNPPAVFGYSSTIFGATAAACHLRKLPADVTANALAIAASISPVNAHWSWFNHTPPSTTKYQLGGVVAQSAITACHMAEFGHRGELQILDDGDFGYRRFIGSSKWEPEHLTERLGDDWRFPAALAYKPYPHCRVMHSAFGAMIAVLEEHDIQPAEIDGIKVYVEAMTQQPVWLNRDITHVIDGQFSIAHGMALAAHRPPSDKTWQEPALVNSSSVLSLMAKVTVEIHPDYVQLLTANAASRPGRVEVQARGQTFVGEQRYPKGSRSPEPGSAMTDEELVAKFSLNASGVLDDAASGDVAAGVMSLETFNDVRPLMSLVAGPADA